MRILILDQCSGSKAYPDDATVHDLAALNSASKGELIEQGNSPPIPARELYTGRQQQYINEATESLRASGHEVDHYFISAGFGLVGENEPLPPYEVTFNEMNQSEIDARARRLSLPSDVQRLWDEDSYDIVFFPLGSDYYRALGLEETLTQLPTDSVGVVFNAEEIAARFEHIESLSARTEDAQQDHLAGGVVSVKGGYLKNFARNVSPDAHSLCPDLVAELCTAVPQ